MWNRQAPQTECIFRSRWHIIEEHKLGVEGSCMHSLDWLHILLQVWNWKLQSLTSSLQSITNEVDCNEMPHSSLKPRRWSHINPKEPQTENVVFNDPEEACNWLTMNSWRSADFLRTSHLWGCRKTWSIHLVMMLCLSQRKLNPSLNCTSAPQHHFIFIFASFTRKCSSTATNYSKIDSMTKDGKLCLTNTPVKVTESISSH